AGGDSCDSGAGGNGAWNGRRAAHKENLAGSGGEDRMKQLAFIAALMLASAGFHPVRAQSVTLYTAGPESLAKDIAKALGDKTGIKVEIYQATSGDVLARLEAEKAKPRADVAVLASWGEGLAVRERGLVDPYSSPEAKKLRPQWSDGGLAAQGGAALALIVN